MKSATFGLNVISKPSNPRILILCFDDNQSSEERGSPSLLTSTLRLTLNVYYGPRHCSKHTTAII